MAKSETLDKQIISSKTSEGLIFMMSEVIRNGTGKRAQFSNWELAGKTGTSQSARDAWFIGFSKNYIAGVWIGYDDNTPLRGVTGGGVPADIWRSAMEEIHSTLIPTPLLTNKIYTDLGTNKMKTIDESSSFGKSLGQFFNRLFNSN